MNKDYTINYYKDLAKLLEASETPGNWKFNLDYPPFGDAMVILGNSERSPNSLLASLIAFLTDGEQSHGKIEDVDTTDIKFYPRAAGPSILRIRTDSAEKLLDFKNKYEEELKKYMGDYVEIEFSLKGKEDENKA